MAAPKRGGGGDGHAHQVGGLSLPYVLAAASIVAWGHESVPRSMQMVGSLQVCICRPFLNPSLNSRPLPPAATGAACRTASLLRPR